MDLILIKYTKFIHNEFYLSKRHLYNSSKWNLYLFFKSQKFKKKTISRIFADYFFLKLKIQILIQKTA